MYSPSKTARRESRTLRFLFRALASIGLLVVVVTTLPVVSWCSRAMGGPWQEGPCDTLVVLTGSHLDNGILGYSSYWRAVYAVLAYRQHPYQEIILSGGGGGTQTAARSMQDFLVASGVPASAIRLDEESTSTRESALFVGRMLRDHTGCEVLLTSDYHMFRAYRVFRREDLDLRPHPIPDSGKRGAQWTGRWPAFVDLVTETVKIGYYKVRGWI